MLEDAKRIFNNGFAKKERNMNRCPVGDSQEIIPPSYNFRTAVPECASPVMNQGRYIICPCTYLLRKLQLSLCRRCCYNSRRPLVHEL